MKTYNNGPRKGMMYGGMTRRKPMMYGGMTTKKKTRRKAYGGGMMSATQPQQNQMSNMTPNQMNNMQTQMMQTPKLKMAGGGKLKEPDNPGLKKLPKKVRNRMGFMAEGGDVLMETRQQIKDRLKKKDSSLTEQEISRLYNIAEGMAIGLDPKGRISDQDIERMMQLLNPSGGPVRKDKKRGPRKIRAGKY